MDANAFDELVARIFHEASRRNTVKGVVAGAVAVAGVPLLTEAKKGQGKDKHRRGKGDKRKDKAEHNGKAHNEGKATRGKHQVRTERKKPFCLCPGTTPANCTATNCVNCVSQGAIGKGKRKQLKKANPFSFVGECPAPPTTTSTTLAPPTTTTARPTTTTPWPPVTTTTTTSTTTSTTTTTTTTTTTPPPPTCPAGQVALSNGTCALPCTGSLQCTNIGCGGCIGTATGDFCRDGSGPLGNCATDNDCPQGQFCVTEFGAPFACTGACPANAG